MSGARGEARARFVDLRAGSLEAALRAVLAFVNDGALPEGVAPPHGDEEPVALRVREVLRDYLVNRTLAEVAAANALAEEFPVRLRFDVRDGYPACDLDPVPEGFGAWVAWSLAVLHSALAAGYADRMKVCRNDECGWLFFDESRNRSRQWCDMSVCGSRMKARAYRARRRNARA